MEEDEQDTQRKRKNRLFKPRKTRARAKADFKPVTQALPCDLCGKSRVTNSMARNALEVRVFETFFPNIATPFKEQRPLHLCSPDRTRFTNFMLALDRPIVTHAEFDETLRHYRNVFGLLKSPRKKETGSTYGALLTPGMRKLFNSIPIDFELMVTKGLHFLDIGHGDGSVVVYATLVRGMKACGIEINKTFFRKSKSLRHQLMKHGMKGFSFSDRKAVSFPHLLELDFINDREMVGRVVRRSSIIFCNNRVFGPINVSLASLLADYAQPGAYIALTDPLFDSQGYLFYSSLEGRVRIVQQNISFADEEEQCLSWCDNTTTSTYLHVYRML